MDSLKSASVSNSVTIKLEDKSTDHISQASTSSTFSVSSVASVNKDENLPLMNRSDLESSVDANSFVENLIRNLATYSKIYEIEKRAKEANIFANTNPIADICADKYKAKGVSRFAEHLGKIKNPQEFILERIDGKKSNLVKLSVKPEKNSNGDIVIERIHNQGKAASAHRFHWTLGYKDSEQLLRYCTFNTKVGFRKAILPKEEGNLNNHSVSQDILMLIISYREGIKRLRAERSKSLFRTYLSSDMIWPVEIKKTSAQSKKIITEIGYYRDKQLISSFKHRVSIKSATFSLQNKAAKPKRNSKDICLNQLDRVVESGEFQRKALSLLKAKYKLNGERDFHAEAVEVLQFFEGNIGSLLKKYVCIFAEREESRESFIECGRYLKQLISACSEGRLLPNHDIASIYRDWCYSCPHPLFFALANILTIKACEIEHLAEEPTEIGSAYSSAFKRKIKETRTNIVYQLASSIQDAQKLGIIEIAEMQMLQRQMPYLQEAIAYYNKNLSTLHTQEDSLSAHSDHSSRGAPVSYDKFVWSVSSRGEKEFITYEEEKKTVLKIVSS